VEVIHLTNTLPLRSTGVNLGAVSVLIFAPY
jgi:hypothetical protein